MASLINLARALPFTAARSAPIATSRGEVAGQYPLLTGWQWVLITIVASRLLIFAVIGLARMTFVKGDVWQPGGIFTVLLQWDAELWYVTIARQGYTYSPDFPSSMGFFPFYPLVVIRLFSLLFEDMRVAAVVASHVCLVGAGLCFNALINVDFKDQRVNRAAVALLMFSPVSFFFSHAYTESTFLLLSLGAFLAARKGQWLIACVCGGCLTATRNVGMLIALPLFVEYVHQTWRPGATWRDLLHPRILLFAIIPAGFGLFTLYSYVNFGTPFAYLEATKVWGREFVAPWRTLANTSILPRFYQAFFLGILSAGLLLYAAALYFKLRLSYLVYATLLITIYLCGASLEAIPRYLTIVFPLFIAMGLIVTRWPWAYLPLLAASTVLLTLCNILSAMGYWMT